MECHILKLEAERIVTAEEAQVLRIYRAMWYISNNRVCPYKYPTKSYKRMDLNSLKDRDRVSRYFESLDNFIDIYGFNSKNIIRKISLNKTPETIMNRNACESEIVDIKSKIDKINYKISRGVSKESDITRKRILNKKIELLKSSESPCEIDRSDLRKSLSGIKGFIEKPIKDL